MYYDWWIVNLFTIPVIYIFKLHLYVWRWRYLKYVAQVIWKHRISIPEACHGLQPATSSRYGQGLFYHCDLEVITWTPHNRTWKSRNFLDWVLALVQLKWKSNLDALFVQMSTAEQRLEISGDMHDSLSSYQPMLMRINLWYKAFYLWPEMLCNIYMKLEPSSICGIISPYFMWRGSDIFFDIQVIVSQCQCHGFVINSLASNRRHSSVSLFIYLFWPIH